MTKESLLPLQLTTNVCIKKKCPFTDEEVKKKTWIEAIAGNEIITLDDHTPDNQKPVSPDLTEEELLTLWKSGKLWIKL